MTILQLLGAFVTAHLNRLAADRDLDGAVIELAIARRTRLLNHDISPFEYANP
jgi:hypothetical protein